MGRPGRNIPLGRGRRRCQDNIKMDLQRVRLGDVAWIDLGSGQGQVVGVCESCKEPSCYTKCSEILD